MSILFTKDQTIEVSNHRKVDSVGTPLAEPDIMKQSGRFNENRSCWALLLIMGLSACSSGSSGDDPYAQRGGTQDPPHSVAKGPLNEIHRSLLQSPYREKCDQKLLSIQQQLIQALDQKNKWLLDSSLRNSTPDIQHIAFDKSFLIDSTRKKPSQSGWQKSPYSWEMVYQYFKANEYSKEIRIWRQINAYVRSLLTDDQRRVIHGFNYALDHQSAHKIHQLKAAIDLCDTNPRCLIPDWTEEQKLLISSIPHYAHYQAKIDESETMKDHRKWINRMRDRIQSDHELHSHLFNPLVIHSKKDGKNEFIVPFESGSLRPRDLDILWNAVASLWKSDSDLAFIDWKFDSAPNAYFKFLFPLEPNQRSFVNFNLKTVTIYPFTSLRTIAHEFGHVLGLDDHYFTLWNPERCEYSTEYNEEDLMSSPDSGEVTSEEWEYIRTTYQSR